MLFCIIFLVCSGFECLQQCSRCKESLHVKSMPIEELTSLAPSNVITYLSCLAPINTMEEVDNSRKFESVEKDEGSILEPETHAMPPVGVINKGHLVQELLPIHTHEDPCMIQLLGCQTYINIISNAPIGWVVGVCSSLKLCSSFFYHSSCVSLQLLVV
jgi:hypothetical protein